MQTKELLSILDAILLPENFKEYAPNGLQVGNPLAPLGNVATAVTADLFTIEQAIQHDIQTLIVHHGILWNKAPLPIVGSQFKRLQLLIKNHINLIAYHLPLDAHPIIGNNAGVALALGWDSPTPFGRFSPKIGFGGSFPPVHVKEFQNQLTELYGSDPIASALGGPEIVSSAAVVSGGAYSEIISAAREGYHCFISGNFDEPAWSLAHEEGIHFFAFGHTATEKIGPKLLCDLLNEQIQIPTIFLDTDNPF